MVHIPFMASSRSPTSRYSGGGGEPCDARSLHMLKVKYQLHPPVAQMGRATSKEGPEAAN
jgi:hypothetical protein